MATFRCEGIDGRKLQALLNAAAKALLGAGGGNGQLLQQNVEALDRQLAGFGAIPQQFSAGGTHLLQSHIGGRQRAVLQQDVPQPARVHRKDAGITRHQGVAHITQEPAHVAHGFAHEGRAVLGHADGIETCGQNNPYIRIATGEVEQPGQKISTLGGSAFTGEGANGLLKSDLVCSQGCAFFNR